MKILRELPANPQPFIQWLDRNPEVVSTAVDVAILLASASFVITRVSLGKLKTSLENTVASLKNPGHDKYTLDPNTKLKQSIYFHINKLLNSTNAQWVSLGILSNGEVSEFGYHFCNLNWDFLTHEPNAEVPLESLKELNATEVSVKLFNQPLIRWIEDSPEKPSKDSLGLSMHFSGYQTMLYGLHLNNILIGVIAMGYHGEPPQPEEPLLITLKELETTLASKVSKPKHQERRQKW